MFQSSPAVSSGRYPKPVVINPVNARFNPRPPFPAGATVLPDQSLKTTFWALVCANVSALKRNCPASARTHRANSL